MATYAVDSTKQALRATGIVEPVATWVEDAITGKRRQSDVQDADEKGTPLWAVEVSYVTASFGRQATAVAKVKVPVPTESTVQPFEVVQFEGLAVDVSVNRANGALREYWSAEGMGGATSIAAKTPARAGAEG